MNVHGRPDANGAGNAEEGGKRLSGAQRKKLAKEERKNKRGANKGRRFQKVRDEVELCYRVASGKQCDFGQECVPLLLAVANLYFGAASRLAAVTRPHRSFLPVPDCYGRVPSALCVGDPGGLDPSLEQSGETRAARHLILLYPTPTAIHRIDAFQLGAALHMTSRHTLQPSQEISTSPLLPTSPMTRRSSASPTLRWRKVAPPRVHWIRLQRVPCINVQASASTASSADS